MNMASSGPQIIQTTGPNGQTQFIMIQQAPNEDSGHHPGNSGNNTSGGGGQDLVDLLRNAQNPDGGPGGNPQGPGGNHNGGGLRVVQTPQGQIVIPNGQNLPGNGGGYTPTIVQQTPMGNRQIVIQQPDDGPGQGGQQGTAGGGPPGTESSEKCSGIDSGNEIKSQFLIKT